MELRYSLGTDPATGDRRVVTITVKGDRKVCPRKSCGRLLRAGIPESMLSKSHDRKEWLTTWLENVRAEVAPKSHERL